ncbi:MAG: Rpn family recombination-promoting nuclease/putative transposase [Clostridiales bacterium]|nr:Rpn family recombination-promoting nuclease/putative transposase [Clostridiales bacterium]
MMKGETGSAVEKNRNKKVSASKGKIGGQGKEKDSATALVFKKNKNFAEVFNRTLFTEMPISEEDLIEKDIRETATLHVTKDAHTTLTRYRDVVKGVKREYLLAILGIENQTVSHNLMPFRVLEMDFLNYARQIRVISDQHKFEKKIKERESPGIALSGEEYLSDFYKDDYLIPCITLVVYWGNEPWQGPRKLSDLFVNSKWSVMASDYQMHLLEVQQMTNDEIKKYDTELRSIFGFVKYSHNKRQLRDFIDQNEDAFSDISMTAIDAIAELTHSTELKKIKSPYESGEGDGIDMCQALKEMIEEGREEGRKEEREKTNCIIKELQEENRRLKAKLEALVLAG